jgi:hypothetical protein
MGMKRIAGRRQMTCFPADLGISYKRAVATPDQTINTESKEKREKKGNKGLRRKPREKEKHSDSSTIIPEYMHCFLSLRHMDSSINRNNLPSHKA